MNELSIKSRDWIAVFAIGLAFSTFLSVLGYRLLSLPIVDGAVFGIALGFLISLFSILFISAMNRFILPRIAKFWWNGIAAFFSFGSGFLATWVISIGFERTPLAMVSLLHEHTLLAGSMIGILTYLIGALNYRFVKMRNEKEYLDTLWVQSRIRSLETQLNPHFLFNALNSLAELVYHDPLKAEASILKMSTFLRATMKEASLIPLSEEIRNARDYIDLENLRFEGKIGLNVIGEIPSVSVPKFSIQLLCENAVKHGFYPKNDFVIEIRIKHDEGVDLFVSNNGRRITSPRYGIGLSNLQERLSHLCGGFVRIENLEHPCYRIHLKECHENPDRR